MEGRASYYSLRADGQVNRDAAWYYPTPSSAASSVAGRIAFWLGVKIDDDGTPPPRGSFFERFRREPPVPAAAPTAVEVAGGHDIGDAPVTDVDDASFFTMLDGHVILADFWAPWCGPCTTLHPMFDDQAIGHGGDTLRFVRVNVDESPGVATAFNIMSIPTIIVFDADGHEIDREVGVPSRRCLDQMVRRAGSLATSTVERGVG